jgi:hypothetical protein
MAAPVPEIMDTTSLTGSVVMNEGDVKKENSTA